MALGWQVGALAAALLTPVLLPHIGWRGMFVVGIFLHLWFGIYEYAYMNLKFSHENRPHFLPKTSKLESFKLFSEGQRNHKSEPWCSSVNFRTKLRLLRHYDLMPNSLSKQLGFSLTKSGLWTAVTVCGMMAGIWILVV